METSLNISAEEFVARAERLRAYLDEQGLDGAVLFDGAYVLYFTGFAFIPTERPVGFLMSAKGEKALFVPRLEVEHAHLQSGFERVESYAEYPGEQHPMEALAGVLNDMGVRNLGGDNDGYPWILGYRGPNLSALTGGKFTHIAAFVEDAMAIKSEAELMLIRESVRWGNLAHRLLQRYTVAGVSETEVSMKASDEATLAMLDTLGHLYRSHSMWQSGASAGYRGQIGRGGAIPHALANNVVFKGGDVLVTGANAPLWGYNSELERTMIIGEPTQGQIEMFGHMMKLQTLAIETMRPGVKCSDVDRAVRGYFEEHSLMRFWKHHTGHAIGLRYHEGPFLDIGDDTELKPGMVFTVEPGLYTPDLGGFRHSDTVAITEDGVEIITYYPRDLESLTIPV